MNKYIIKQAIDEYDTPFYLYDRNKIEKNLNCLVKSLFCKSKLYFSMKANPLLGICQFMRSRGCGVEVASKGELYVALQSGFEPKDIIFTGPGKTVEELQYAIDNGIKLINIESLEEACIINEIAGISNTIMPIAVRVNPIASMSNAQIKMSGVSSQFGIEEELLNSDFFKKLKNLRYITLMGIQVYMGTQILSATELLKNTEYIINLALKMANTNKFHLRYLNMGGGFGVPYFPNEAALDMVEVKKGMEQLETKYGTFLKEAELIFESGRYLLANAGTYVTKVLYCKESKGKKFLVCDGGANFHAASAFLGRFVRNNYPLYVLDKDNEKDETTITGPLCTPTDIIGQNVKISNDVVAGDYIVILKSGAYGLTYSPLKFLSHESPTEIIFDRNDFKVLRERGTVEDALIGQNAFY